jgi:hypothetical protein
MQPVELPLNLFKALPGMLAAVPAIFICWPMAAIFYYLGRRNIEVRDARTFWHRLPLPFGGLRSASTFDGKCYWLFFFIVFQLLPIVHLLVFGIRFFLVHPPQPLFEWSWEAAFNGNAHFYPADIGDAKHSHGLSYYPAWEGPLIVLIALWLLYQGMRFFAKLFSPSRR